MSHEPEGYKFKILDRVKRLEDVFRPSSRMFHGIVIESYSKTSHFLGIYYPEMYDVHWDHGDIGRGYLPHGLEKE